MKIAYIDGNRLRRAVVAGARFVIRNQGKLDEINVFPVPDGDTGTNMASTLRPVADQGNLWGERSLEAASLVIADATLMGARGNSGAILAQFFQGLADGVQGQHKINTEAFAQAIQNAAIAARAAVSEPQEGTILTVIQKWAEWLSEKATHTPDFKQLIPDSMEHLKSALRSTTQQLQSLKSAGVVDAGAQGFVYLIEGIAKFIENGKIEKMELAEAAHLQIQVAHNEEDIKFRYCTECLLSGTSLDLSHVRNALTDFGDSLVVAGSPKKMRVHLHTDAPLMVFETLEKFGEVTQQKADDMRLQHADAWATDKAPVAIVVDSGCDLPPEFLQKHHIHTVPLRLNFGEKSYIDGVTIDAPTFFRKLQTEAVHPTTSQPTPADFERMYQMVMRHYPNAISLHVPSKLSGTYQSAHRAAQGVSDNIHLLDTKSGSVGIGLLVMELVEALEKGASLKELLTLTEENIQKLQTFIALPTIDFVVKGGRLGKLQGAMGKFLNVKPVLTFSDEGLLENVAKATGKKSVHEALLNHLVKSLNSDISYKFGVGHAHAPEVADWYQQKLLHHFPKSTVFIAALAPVLAVHGGPGCIGLGVLPTS